MLRPSAPMSNIERQRRFRERHPGYYGRLHRKRRAFIKAILAQRGAEANAQAQAEAHAQAELLAHAKAIVASCNRVPLMLPAPTIDPLASEIAALAEKRNARAAAVCEMKVGVISVGADSR